MEQKKTLKKFIKNHFKGSISDNFLSEGSWITLEFKNNKNVTITIPAKITGYKKKKLNIKTRIPLPEGIKTEGFLYSSFDVDEIEKDLFQDVKSTRYKTHFEIVEIPNKKNETNIKLTDGLFTRVERRDFERLICKKHYNISIKPVPIDEKDENSLKYNKYMERFFSNIILKDLSPGGVCVLSKTDYASKLKYGLKINVNICLGSRVDYQYKKQLFSSETTPKEFRVTVRVEDVVESKNDLLLRFIIIHDVKSQYIIINESFKMRQSDACLATSCVNENRKKILLK
jgi:hypothetical protein